MTLTPEQIAEGRRLLDEWLECSAINPEHPETLRLAAEAQDWLRDHAPALLDRAEAAAHYEDGITWQTECLQCAELMNKNYAAYAEAEELRKQLAEPRCVTCREGRYEQVVIDEDGTLASVSGLPGFNGHAVDDYFWFCDDQGSPPNRLLREQLATVTADRESDLRQWEHERAELRQDRWQLMQQRDRYQALLEYMRDEGCTWELCEPPDRERMCMSCIARAALEPKEKP